MSTLGVDKIEAAWRGYRVRKLFNRLPPEIKTKISHHIASENRSSLRMKRLLQSFAIRRLDIVRKSLGFRWSESDMLDIFDSITRFWGVMNYDLRQTFHRMLSRLHLSVFNSYRRLHLLQYRINAKHFPYVVCVLPRTVPNFRQMHITFFFPLQPEDD